MIKRRKNRTIYLGGLAVGGDAPVRVQSMTNTLTQDIESTCCQIGSLAKAGCEIVRVAVPDMKSAKALKDIVKQSPVPVIGDIHFNHELALKAIDAGVHGLRLNPGNINHPGKLKAVAEKAKAEGVPIRVGANSGSLAKNYRLAPVDIQEQTGYIADALVSSALEQCKLLEKYGFRDIKVSLKSSDVKITIEAYRKFARLTDYPLHVGVTEAGTPEKGVIKSAIAIGALLADGIGDTIRVSLTAPPEQEVYTAIKILESIGLRQAYPEIISCPTCARTKTNLFELVKQVETLVNELICVHNIRISCKKIAVMGCEVNGPGEAGAADIGIFAMDKDKLMLFKNGKRTGIFSIEQSLLILKEFLSSQE